MIALIVGTLLAVAVLAFVLFPLLRDTPTAGPETALPSRPSDAPTPLVSAAETVSDDEVEAALAAYRQAVTVCPVCGPRPERGAVFCSSCGRRLAAG